MTDRPILFSAPMIRAILREVSAPGTGKTQTRRVLKPQPAGTPYHQDDGSWLDVWPTDLLPCGGYSREACKAIRIPYAPGDRLWVREAISYDRLDVDRDGILPPWYWADGNPDAGDWTRPKPSIHMPRWASRLTLHVTDVRVQRLQDISEDDAQAEGCPCQGDDDLCGMEAAGWFRDLWDSLNAERAPWSSNPWVVAVTFQPVLGNIDRVDVHHD